MGSKSIAMLYVYVFYMLITLPPAFSWQQNCPPPYPPYGGRPSPPSTPEPRPHPPPKHHPHHPPSPPKHHPHPHNPSPPHHGGGSPPTVHPPVVLPPIIRPPPIIAPPIIMPPPITNPPVTRPPPSSSYPPYTPPGGGGGGGGPPPAATCPIDALKLGLCLDVLGRLVHVGIGNPVENLCCPVIQGLLELEAAICLCTTIMLKLLNLHILLPLTLQLMATCGLNPPQGFVCPPL